MGESWPARASTAMFAYGARSPTWPIRDVRRAFDLRFCYVLWLGIVEGSIFRWVPPLEIVYKCHADISAIYVYEIELFEKKSINWSRLYIKSI